MLIADGLPAKHTFIRVEVTKVLEQLVLIGGKHLHNLGSFVGVGHKHLQQALSHHSPARELTH